MYGLVAWPFLIFRLPLMGGFLTRARATGYDRRGRTVLLQVDKHPLTQNQTKAAAIPSDTRHVEDPHRPDPEARDTSEACLLQGSESDMDDLLREFDRIWDSSHGRRRGS